MDKRLSPLLLVFVVIALLLISANAVFASPYIAETYYLPGTCDDFHWTLHSRSLSWDVNGLSNITFDEVQRVNGNIVYSQLGTPYPISGSGTSNWQYSDNVVTVGNGTTMPYDFSYTLTWKANGQNFAELTITGHCANGVANSTVNNSSSGGNSASPFTDGRVDGRPGDRIAIYCKTDTNTLEVWGIDRSGNGFLAALFDYYAVVGAGSAGVTRYIGINGSISASVDSQNNFWVAWNGGQYNATGQGDFAKGFHCDYPKPTILGNQGEICVSFDVYPLTYDWLSDPTNQLSLLDPGGGPALFEVIKTLLDEAGLAIDVLGRVTEPLPDNVHINVYRFSNHDDVFMVEVIRERNGNLLARETEIVDRSYITGNKMTGCLTRLT